ncbi:MAG: deoxyguanosinetriphosphate triphosphohydrolase [Clostridiales bacterium]|nr:deoxyguanosinetriphosphate triphosphohydrolase [Clostridiales bacterium]MDY3746877.1 deoxyguanosinetriphosphate triphosphohydrolase [Lachnospiraceae bacterium]
MTIRERMEQYEADHLSPYASLSINSRGRDKAEEPCDVRPCYQRDRDRILHSKSFRRLKHKTQVFLAPTGDHYRTRLTHTLEVAQIGRTIARALRLNEDLAEAIALGHDLGHTPFGHSGEAVLNQICPYGFKHYEQSVRIVERLEKNGRGLNLTWEVRDGMRNHSTVNMPSTLEGKIIRLSDKIAYINHDIDDAIRGHIIVEEEIPSCYTDILGHSSKQRLNTLIHDIIIHSFERNDIFMSPHIENAMIGLRKYMFANVYTNKKAKSEEKKAQNLLEVLYEYYMKHPEKMSPEYVNFISSDEEPKERIVCDYISGMTDQFAISTYEDLCIPSSWKVY